ASPVVSARSKLCTTAVRSASSAENLRTRSAKSSAALAWCERVRMGVGLRGWIRGKSKKELKDRLYYFGGGRVHEKYADAHNFRSEGRSIAPRQHPCRSLRPTEVSGGPACRPKGVMRRWAWACMIATKAPCRVTKMLCELSPSAPSSPTTFR